MLQSLLRLCFRPTPADRLWRGWLNVGATILSIVGIYMSFHRHQPWGALSTAFMTFWNGVNIWANFLIYWDWKHGKPLPSFFKNIIPEQKG